MATCTPKSANQNITAYGVMLFVSRFSLVFLLCSCLGKNLGSGKC